MTDKLVTVRMRAKINGYRDNEEWPPVGGTIDLRPDEADDIVAMGMAEFVTSRRGSTSVETADAESTARESSVLTTSNARGGR